MTREYYKVNDIFYNYQLGKCKILKTNYPKILLYVDKGTKHYIVAKMYKKPDIYYKHDYYDLDKAEEFYERYIKDYD